MKKIRLYEVPDAETERRIRELRFRFTVVPKRRRWRRRIRNLR